MNIYVCMMYMYVVYVCICGKILVHLYLVPCIYVVYVCLCVARSLCNCIWYHVYVTQQDALAETHSCVSKLFPSSLGANDLRYAIVVELYLVPCLYVVCVCKYVYTHTCIHLIYMDMYIYIYTYVYKYIYMYTYMCICMYDIYMYIYTYTCGNFIWYRVSLFVYMCARLYM